MIEKTFVDSNILLYAHDSQAGPKQSIAAARLTELWHNRAGRLSAQVLQEFYVNVTRKIPRPLPPSLAREIIRNYTPWLETPTTAATIVRASELSELSQLSFSDSLILASAEQDAAAILLTEDLNHGQSIAGITIVNPFR